MAPAGGGQRRAIRGLALIAVALLALRLADAARVEIVDPGRLAPPAVAPQGVPVPTPQISITPPACAAQVVERTKETESRRKSAATVVSGTLPSGKPARSRADEALLRTSQALCCITYPLAIPGSVGFNNQDLGGRAVCQGVLQPYVLRGDLKTSGTYMDNLQACVDLTKAAAGALGSASSAGLPKVAQAALSDLRSSTEKVAQALETCKPTTPTAVVPQPIGGVCTAAADCATQACEGGRCILPGVAALGQCDAVRHCGPGLECRAGQCRLPCACPPGCLVSSQSACQRTVPQSNTVRKSCNLVMGQCPFPCFKDSNKACKIDTIEATTKQESCALVCP